MLKNKYNYFIGGKRYQDANQQLYQQQFSMPQFPVFNQNPYTNPASTFDTNNIYGQQYC